LDGGVRAGSGGASGTRAGSAGADGTRTGSVGGAGAGGTRRLPAGPVVLRQAWADVTSSPTALAALLDGMTAHGVALVTGVPTRPGAVTEVAGLFGPVWETDHGRVFDVRAGADTDGPADQAVAPHTDNAYRESGPTVAVLECLQDGAAGDDTVLVDGFEAVTRLDRRYPAAGRLLRRYPQRWLLTDKTSYLGAVASVIDEAPGVGLRQVRFDERTRTPASAPSDVVTDVLVALAALGRVVAAPGLQARLHLVAGDALVLDTRRMLHGRTAVRSGGARWLQGCYADMDSLRSRLAVLRRDGA
ncbi:MAG TPA: TauD/TfdA family dioxygenase, partial [Acidimicrobiales bacterium]|nr:TauD/TfdA family dioxygenase [Acidimicrobiales bacterium]